MRNIKKLIIAMVMGVGLVSAQAGAADQTATLMLKGKSCASHPKEITDGLMGVKGVKAVDLKSIKGHAVVAHDGTVKPEALIEVLKKVKGQDWSCDAEVMP